MWLIGLGSLRRSCWREGGLMILFLASYLTLGMIVTNPLRSPVVIFFATFAFWKLKYRAGKPARGSLQGADPLKGSHVRLLVPGIYAAAGGPTTQLLNIVRYLDGDRFEPVVVTLSPEPADSMRSSFENLGARVESLLLSRPRGYGASTLARRYRTIGGCRTGSSAA